MGLWFNEIFEKVSNLVPEDDVTSTIIKYGPPIGLAGFAGYKIWQWSQENSRKVQCEDADEETVQEYSGVLKLLPCKYEAGNFDENKTKSVYIVVNGPLLEMYEASEYLPMKELHNEPEIELTFYRKTSFNLFGCQIKLLPEKLDKVFKWDHCYPIEIILRDNSLVEDKILCENHEIEHEVVSKKSLVLFARSDRDKEAWTRKLKSATNKTKFAPLTQDPITFINAGKPYREKPPLYIHRKIQGVWLNSLLSRIITDGKTKELIEASLTFQVQELLNNLKIGDKMETLLRMTVYKIDLQNFGTPKIMGISIPHENDLGLWEEVSVKYNGLLKIIVEIKLNPKTYGKDDEERPACQNYEDTPWISRVSYLNYLMMGGVLERTRFYLEINMDLLKGNTLKICL